MARLDLELDCKHKISTNAYIFVNSGCTSLRRSANFRINVPPWRRRRRSSLYVRLPEFIDGEDRLSSSSVKSHSASIGPGLLLIAIGYRFIKPYKLLCFRMWCLRGFIASIQLLQTYWLIVVRNKCFINKNVSKNLHFNATHNTSNKEKCITRNFEDTRCWLNSRFYLGRNSYRQQSGRTRYEVCEKRKTMGEPWKTWISSMKNHTLDETTRIFCWLIDFFEWVRFFRIQYLFFKSFIHANNQQITTSEILE